MFKKIVAASVIVLSVLTLNSVQANELDWFESIFNSIEEEFSCTYIEREMTQHKKYKRVIDNYFRKISNKNISTQRKIYKKLDDLATRKLTTINRNTQSKVYAIIGYIKCEAEKKSNYLNNEQLSIDYKLDKLGNLYLIKNGQTYFVDSVDWGIKNISIWEKYLLYDWISTWGILKKVYDIKRMRHIWKVNWWKVVGNIIYGCFTALRWPEGIQPGLVEVLNFHTWLNKKFRPDNLVVNSCKYIKWDLYFILEDDRWYTENYKYNTFTDKLYVNAARFYDTWWAETNFTFPKIFTTITNVPKKWTFIKYIWWWVEARQNSLYTYFYYKWRLINTVKNQVKNDERLLHLFLCENESNGYLDKNCASMKLRLYSASIKYPFIFFQKKIDFGTMFFKYNIKTGKVEWGH